MVDSSQQTRSSWDRISIAVFGISGIPNTYISGYLKKVRNFLVRIFPLGARLNSSVVRSSP